jgi:hypothetical protein
MTAPDAWLSQPPATSREDGSVGDLVLWNSLEEAGRQPKPSRISPAPCL